MLTQIRIDNLCNVLATAKKSFDIRVTADAPHSFLNDTMLGRYRASQAQAAWGQILFFLDATLNKGWDKERASLFTLHRTESQKSQKLRGYDIGRS
jgi:hypothetical protein